MIDIHSHLLPGVDDGSPSVAVSVRVLKRFAAQGVECVVLTPHLTASRAATAPYERHVAILEALRAAWPEKPELQLGWEIMLDTPNADLRAPQLSLGKSTAVLVEFPRMNVPQAAAQELHRIRSSGRVPVLAHPERYWGCTVERVAEWRAAGAVIQMDTAGLIGRGAIATHGDARSIATARDWLLEVATPEHAELLTRTNARRLLDSEPLVPVPPLRPERGIFDRLRELFTRP
jgi:protein-tyrosine phosphatase